jgi:hypothetical protein
MKIIFGAIIIFYSFFSFAYNNDYFTQSNPQGWIQQPSDIYNYIFLASVISKEKLPVLVSMSLEKKIEPNKIEAFLTKEIKEAFQSEKKVSVNIFSQGLKIPDFHKIVEFSYLSEGELYKGLALIIPEKDRYHFFQFSCGEKNYEVFSKDVIDVFNSTQLKKTIRLKK